MRILGYDTSHHSSISDEDLVEEALRENRTIVTRDSRLAERRLIKDLVLVRSGNFREQLKQVMEEKGLRSFAGLFTRCLLCNELVSPMRKEETRGKVPDYVYQTEDSFQQCPKCGKIYWSGSHRQKVQESLEKIR